MIFGAAFEDGGPRPSSGAAASLEQEKKVMKSTVSLVSILVLTLFAGVLTAQEAESEKITFKHKAPGKGDVQFRVSNMDMNQTIEISAEMMPEPMEQTQDMKITEKRRTTILAAKDGKVTKLRIQIMEFDMNMKMTMAGEEMPMGADAPDFSGKVLIAELQEDGSVKVTDEQGAEVDENLSMMGRSEFSGGDYVGWGPRLEKILPSRPIAMNETIDVPVDRAKDFLPGMGGAQLGKASKMSLKLVGKKRSLGTDLAVFELETKFGGSPDLGELTGGQMPDLNLDVSATLTGKIEVGVNNLWVYGMEMKGPMSMTREPTEEMPMSMNSEGTISNRGASMYTKEKAAAPAESK